MILFFSYLLIILSQNPGGSPGKESACSVGDQGSIPGLGRSPGEGKVPTLVLWPGEFHGLCSPWDQKELDMTEQLSLSYKFNLVFLVKTSFMIGKSYCTKAVHHIASK